MAVDRRWDFLRFCFSPSATTLVPPPGRQASSWWMPLIVTNDVDGGRNLRWIAYMGCSGQRSGIDQRILDFHRDRQFNLHVAWLRHILTKISGNPSAIYGLWLHLIKAGSCFNTWVLQSTYAWIWPDYRRPVVWNRWSKAWTADNYNVLTRLEVTGMR